MGDAADMRADQDHLRDATEHARYHMARTIAMIRVRERDATEHAQFHDSARCYRCYSDDATERELHSRLSLLHYQEYHVLLPTPAFGTATADDAFADHHVLVGPCRIRCMTNELELLRCMQNEIRRRVRVPVTLEGVLKKYEIIQYQPNAISPSSKGKSWSSIIEAISRCIAAFQNAADATELNECEEIATKTCNYAIALAHKTPAYCGRMDLLALVYQYMQNRTYNIAFGALLDESLRCPLEDPFWLCVSTGQRYEMCLRVIEMCIHANRNHAEHLLQEMTVYNSCNRP